MALSPYGSTPVRFTETSTSNGEIESLMQRHVYDLLNILLVGPGFGIIFAIFLLWISGEDLTQDIIIGSSLYGLIVGFLIATSFHGMVIWRSRKQQKKLESKLDDMKDDITDAIKDSMKEGFDRLEASMNRLGRGEQTSANGDKPDHKSPV